MPLVAAAVNGFWKRDFKIQGERLSLSALEQARSPLFYARWEVPDTLEGRFDCASLHIALLLIHVKGPLAQSIFNAFFSYTDLTLREVGISDLSVGKQVKTCAKFFYGALKGYKDALENKKNLEEVLKRNLYGDTTPPYIEEVASYVRICHQSLQRQAVETSKRAEWPLLTK